MGNAFKSVTDAAKAAEGSAVATAKRTTKAVKKETEAQADAHVKTWEKVQKQSHAIMLKSAAMVGQIAGGDVKAEKKARIARLEEVANLEAAKERSLNKAAKAKSAADAKANRESVAAGKKLNSELDKLQRERTRDAQRASEKRVMIDRALSRDAERNADFRSRRIRYEQQQRESFLRRELGGARRIAGRAAGLGMGLARRAGQFGLNVLQGVGSGLGAQMDIGAAVGERVALERASVDLSNRGYIPTASGANGRRQDPAMLRAEAQRVGNETAFSPQAMIAGLTAFAGKTGDLAAGRDVLKDLAILSKATGTNLEHMVDAAGDVYSALGDIPNKGEAIVRVMRSIAGQGQLGAVEISHLATQMAKIGASAGRFEGGGEKNLAIFGAFAQEARQHGGAASAEQAATSVAGFADTFQKSARFHEFAKLKIDVNSATEEGKFRDPQEIILEALSKTAGRDQQQKMGKLFMDRGARRVVTGFAQVYAQASGATQGTAKEKDEAGIKAARAEMDRFVKAAMGQGDVWESFTAAMGTTESKVQIFNNKMGEAAEELARKSLPVLEELGPRLLELFDPLSQLVVPMAGLATEAARWLADITGATKKSDEKAAALEKAGFKDTNERLEGGLRHGEISPQDKRLLDDEKRALTQDKLRRARDVEKLDESKSPWSDKARKAYDWTPIGAILNATGVTDSLNTDRTKEAADTRTRADNAAVAMKPVEELLRRIHEALTDGTARFTDVGVNNKIVPTAPAPASFQSKTQ